MSNEYYEILIRNAIADFIGSIEAGVDYFVTIRDSLTGNFIEPADKAKQPYAHTFFRETDYVGRDHPCDERFPISSYEVNIFVKDAEDSEGIASRSARDVHRVLSRGSNTKLGGLAIETKIINQKVGPYADNPAWYMAKMQIEVQYKHTFGKPGG